MPSTHCSSIFHIVFSTKERRRLIGDEWKLRLHAYMGGITNGLEAVPLAIGGVQDHIHLMVSFRSKHRLDYFVRDLKADSSAWIHREFTKLFEWQKGYGAFSVSPSAIPAIKEYIADQESHHSQNSFESEYVALLQSNGAEYDPRFLW